MPWIKIDKDDVLKAGDLIKIHFRTIGMTWIKAAQIALIEWRLEKRKDFEIVNIDYWQKNKVTFKIRIKGEP